MKPGLRWFGLGFGVLVGLIILVVGGLYFSGSRRIATKYEVQTAFLNIPTDPASVERGAHLVRINGCAECHTASLGGAVLVDEPPFRVVASNLTSGRGGIGAAYTAEDFDRAIRHGVRPTGQSLWVMPAKAYHRLSDEDVGHIIAYVKSVPPVDSELPSTEVRPLGRILTAIRQLDPAFEVRTDPARAAAPAPAPSAEYGAYLTSVTCAYCHGDDLRGAQPPMPGSPPAPSLVATTQWDAAGFEQALRTGVTPDGRHLDPEVMPWAMTANMTQVELSAIRAHLETLASAEPAQ